MYFAIDEMILASVSPNCMRMYYHIIHPERNTNKKNSALLLL
jgi:hypothetical protein